MTDFLQCSVNLQFKFVPLNGEYMRLTITSNVETVHVIPADNVSVQIKVNLPSKVVLHLSGKNPGDTTVDNNGNILQDKHVKLVAASIDRLPIGEHFLLSWPIGSNARTSYFGFNENVVLDFNEPTAFHFALKNNK